MKYFAILLFLLSAPLVSAQKYPQFYVTHQNDTVPCRIVSFSNKKVNIFADGRVRSLNTKKIKGFSWYEDGRFRHFASLDIDRKNFYEEEIKGRISLYKIYSVTQRTPLMMMVKDNRKHHLTLLNYRSKTGQLVADCPTVHELWKQRKFSINDPHSLVHLYNYYMQEGQKSP